MSNLQKVSSELEREVLAMLRPDGTEEETNKEPKTRQVIDKAINVGSMGIGTLASIPSLLGKLHATDKLHSL